MHNILQQSLHFKLVYTILQLFIIIRHCVVMSQGSKHEEFNPSCARLSINIALLPMQPQHFFMS
jgi:hypothetical protein